MESDNVLFNIQIPRSVRDDFRIAAKLRGQSMSSLIHQFIVRTIREEKDMNARKFPDYMPPPEIISEEAEIERRIKAVVLEKYGTDNISDAELNAMIVAVKTLTEVKEITEDERPPGRVVARIEPGKEKELTRADVQRMIDAAETTTPRKRKAG